VSGPLLVFPEGTVTSGKHVMRFKKGAFNSLLPVKPLVINTVTSPNFHLSVGSAGLFPHFIYTLCFLWNTIEVTELPVMTPNEHMFNYYRQKHPELKEDWEVFAEVAREIMCESSHMEKSENTFRDSVDYANTVLGKKKKEKHTTKGTEENLVESNSTIDKI
jgi:1-acyl-sn-glycerol-3-phosphate acyltransferase